MSIKDNLLQRVQQQLEFIYAEVELNISYLDFSKMLVETITQYSDLQQPEPHKNLWTEKDAILITYGDSITQYDSQHNVLEKPLHTLHRFLNDYIAPTINSVHILPFYPYSSDDGFSVINYVSVNESLGEWSDVNAIAKDYNLMADLVINHCSSRSLWYANFKKGKGIGHDYFMPGDPNWDLTQVVRPRTSELLKLAKTKKGEKFVWCTFSHDQVDLNFQNPNVLNEMVNIIAFYIRQGVKVFRLDAVAFLWKKPGTSCINLEETHEAVRLFRTLIEHVAPNAIIITETNIPNRENLAYFGNANEAHCIYNFSLPPLLINTLLTGNNRYLKQWMMSMPPAQNGTCYFNFIASHDGVGLRPAEGLLSDKEINELVGTIQSFGGRVSLRTLPDGSTRPYEMNIALYDALQGTTKGPDSFNEARFLCAHAIMFAMEGIPGVYIHSMIATQNDYEKVKHTNSNRSINRHRWDELELIQKLNDDTHHNRIFNGMRHLLKVRTKQKAFHPNATQFTLHINEQVFGFWRQSMDRKQSIFCIFNITDELISLTLAEINLVVTDNWWDLVTGNEINDTQEIIELKPYQCMWISNVNS
ncbi:sugar phosphorylase [Marinicellulosiphila megalodicopiae]|uniref:sugar phosphorylase n=1 Tax=Marinicellulosiphila megalodicopiae TaxID=2724896 RepID=UPI003BB1FA43